MHCQILSAYAITRGVAGPVETCPLLIGTARYDPSAPNPEGQPQMLDPRERRRTTTTMRLALEAAERCVTASGVAASDIPTVFGSAFGDGPLLGSLLETLATPGARISPTRFHNSVHNAALGYWSIATGCHHGSTSIAAGDYTPGAALLRGLVQVTLEARPVLVVVYDAPFDPPLAAARPVEAAFAAALVLAPSAARALCRLDATIHDSSSGASSPRNRSLDDLWNTNPAARVIPLLECIARREVCTTDIAHSSDGVIRVEVRPP
jgi:hypothetical protein